MPARRPLPEPKPAAPVTGERGAHVSEEDPRDLFPEDPTALPPVDLSPDADLRLQQARTAAILPPGAVPGAEVSGASADLAHDRDLGEPTEREAEVEASEAPDVWGAAATMGKERRSPPPVTRPQPPEREDW